MKNKISYKFMWGQKQSAMITEAMFSQLLLDIDYKGKTVDSKITDDVFILTDGIFEHYMPEKSIRQLEKRGKKNLNYKFSRMLFDLIDKHIKSFFKFCNNLQKKDLKKYQIKSSKKSSPYITITLLKRLFFSNIHSCWRSSIS